jgi:tRNA nucleotidyltransferase (CCA-adding enzyme)
VSDNQSAGKASNSRTVGGASAASRGAELLDALSALPGGPELLALGRGRAELALVGGAVRDLLLGRAPRELDVVVAEEVGSLVRELAARLDVSAAQPVSTTLHDRFGTALVQWDGARVDIAQRRTESYPAPGALPEVRPGTVHQDLARRDFTVNAVALALAGEHRGELVCAEHALEDLDARRLRVLHEQSFIDDPTRIMRLARYRARLGFQVEAHTSELAGQALLDGALMSVSRARLGAELRLALEESDAPGALESMSELGVLAALPPGLRFERELAERALALLPADARADLLLMAALLLHLTVMPGQDPEPVIYGILDELEFTAADRERTLRSVLAAPALVRTMTLAAKPSQLRDALSAHTPEAIALAGALGEQVSPSAAESAREWFERLRGVRLRIDGDDLLAAGVPSGPQVGRRLAHALARKLDGELDDGRDAELRAALEGTVET